MYTDILKSPSCLSLTLQEEEIDVIQRNLAFVTIKEISSEFRT